MKRVTAIGLVAVLATGSGAALADRDGGKHHKGNGHGHNSGKHYDRDYHHGGKHWRGGPTYNVYVARPYYRHRVYYRPYYYPLGAALAGAAVSYSLYHTHDGLRCNEVHSNVGYSPAGSSSEVVGCYRIEHYPDGSERRVDLPVSECY